MTTPRYYRGLPKWFWLALSVAGLLAVVVFVWQLSLSAATERGRLAAVRDADAAAQLVWPAERARWGRERDSLIALTAARDTVLVTRIRTVRQILTDTLHQTDTLVVRACGELADGCAAFRATATAALALADSTRSADSSARVALGLRLVTSNDSLRRARRALDRAPTWRTTVEVGVVGSALGVVICAVLCR